MGNRSLLGVCIPLVLITLIGYVVGPRAPTWDSCGCKWGPWKSWSSCTATCGGGHQIRERKVWHHDTPSCEGFKSCATNDMGSERRSCNTNCFNGGSYNSFGVYGGYCTCREGTRGTCCKQIVTCGQPAPLMNGNLQGSDYSYSHQISYHCNAKYNMTGSSVRTCNKYGYWTGSTPACHYAASCESSPCQNSAPCTNLLDDYHCNCHKGWTGKNCETDIQPPVVDICPDDISTYETALETKKEWRVPIIDDPLGNHVDITSNYPGNSSVFPWGDFTVQYSGAKPSNGLTVECTFNISIRPNPCPALAPPTNGMVVCNNWRTEYTSVCMALCKDGFVFASGPSTYWYNCGASGNWLPPPTPTKCVPDGVMSVILEADLPRLPSCKSTHEQQALGQYYVQKLKTSQFNILCLDYLSSCNEDNIYVNC